MNNGLLVALDFDGTLARLRRDRGAARLPAGRMRLLASLARVPGVRLLVVSGRSLRDLRRLCRGLPAALAGDHGLRMTGLGRSWVHPALPGRSAQARALAEAARAVVLDVAGVEVERKEASVAVHYRRAASGRDGAARLRAALDTLAAEGWRLSPGKRLWEFRPGRTWGKGQAIRLAAGRLGRGWSVLFMGDDETDEEAFRALGRRAWTVRVGSGRTAARWRCAGLREVDALLRGLRRLSPRAAPPAAARA